MTTQEVRKKMEILCRDENLNPSEKNILVGLALDLIVDDLADLHATGQPATYPTAEKTLKRYLKMALLLKKACPDGIVF